MTIRINQDFLVYIPLAKVLMVVLNIYTIPKSINILLKNKSMILLMVKNNTYMKRA